MEKEIYLYIVRNAKNEKGGNFYNIYRYENKNLNLNELLQGITDIDMIESIVTKEDPTFKRFGGGIAKKNETIGSVKFYQPIAGTQLVLTEQETKEYKTIIENEKTIAELEEQKKEVLYDFIEKYSLFTNMQENLSNENELAISKLKKLEIKKTHK